MDINENKESSRSPHIPFFSAVVVAALISIVTISFLTAFPRPYSTKKDALELFVSETLKNWKTKYADTKGLKVGRVDVHFDARPDCFAGAEGAVVAPVGIDLQKGQKILAIAAFPPIIRELRVDGIRCMAWPYPGECRDDYNYVALCLVKQESPGKVIFPEVPTYKQLSPSLATDALTKAAELGVPDLDECAVFQEWAHEMAGGGAYTDQFKRIVTRIADGIIPEDDNSDKDDVCAAIRHNRFKVSQAQVAAVMSCRENNIPCFGFFGATPEKNHIIGMFSDQTGWVYFDFDHPDRGFFSDPPVLLVQTPLFAEFGAAVNDFWSPIAAAYGPSGWGGVRPFSLTVWGRGQKKDMPDITLARTYMLGDPEKP